MTSGSRGASKIFHRYLVIFRVISCVFSVIVENFAIFRLHIKNFVYI